MGWTLKYALINANTVISLVSTVEGDSHLIIIPANSSKTYTSGVYHWQSFLENPTASERYTINSGTMKIIPSYDTDTPQTRGITLATSGIVKLNDLAGYTEAEIIAARVAASKMGFYEVPQGDEIIGTNEEKDTTDKSVITEASPGTLFLSINVRM